METLLAFILALFSSSLLILIMENDDRICFALFRLWSKFFSEGQREERLQQWLGDDQALRSNGKKLTRILNAIDGGRFAASHVYTARVMPCFIKSIKQPVSLVIIAAMIVWYVPFFLWIGASIKLASGTKLFQREEYITYKGKEVRLWKFDVEPLIANSNSSFFKAVCRLGLDRLPNFWSVLIGELTLAEILFPVKKKLEDQN